MAASDLLKVENVAVDFKQLNQHVRVLEDFSFSLKTGQVGSLIGGSGSGKSTLLRTIAGFEPLTSGSISLNGVEVSRPGYVLPTEKRKLGMVFQDFALFPHLTVFRNIESGITHLSKDQRKAIVSKELKRVNLADMADAYPHQLSGGQKQRVAIARALAPRPQLLLMDEPFSNLDPELCVSLRADLHRVLGETKTTCLMVTHDQQDAFAISNLLGVMHAGRLHQWSSPYDVYHHPADRMVANFVGDGAFIPGLANAKGVATEIGLIKGKVSNSWINRKVDVLIRPEDLVHVDSSSLKFPIASRIFRGESFLYSLALPSGQKIQVIVDSHHNHHPGEMLGIKLSLDHLVFFPA